MVSLHYFEIRVASGEGRPWFFDVTEDILSHIRTSAVANGIVVVSTHHTTCSILIQEAAFDLTASGLETLQQDFVDILERISPPQPDDGGFYLHPGPQAIEFAAAHGEDLRGARNTDAHLRSGIIGRSEVIPIIDSGPDLGNFGRVYLIDFDQTRPRERTVGLTVIGE